jgi:hypothetical protein
MLGSMQMIFMLVGITHDPIGKLKLLPISLRDMCFVLEISLLFLKIFWAKNRNWNFTGS